MLFNPVCIPAPPTDHADMILSIYCSSLYPGFTLALSVESHWLARLIAGGLLQNTKTFMHWIVKSTNVKLSRVSRHTDGLKVSKMTSLK